MEWIGVCPFCPLVTLIYDTMERLHALRMRVVRVVVDHGAGLDGRARWELLEGLVLVLWCLGHGECVHLLGNIRSDGARGRGRRISVGRRGCASRMGVLHVERQWHLYALLLANSVGKSVCMHVWRTELQVGAWPL
jgi:hypothetical protein